MAHLDRLWHCRQTMPEQQANQSRSNQKTDLLRGSQPDFGVACCMHLMLAKNTIQSTIQTIRHCLSSFRFIPDRCCAPLPNESDGVRRVDHSLIFPPLMERSRGGIIGDFDCASRNVQWRLLPATSWIASSFRRQCGIHLTKSARHLASTFSAPVLPSDEMLF